MESRSKNINSFWGYLLIEELVRNDITCFCISPGSRSTPITIAAAENKQADKIICLDERAAAFYALGYSRATGKPAVVICTSGTAAANYYPAVIEAKNSQTPLILITADRPPELRETGANQTINQVRMFSNFPKWQFDLPCPDTKIPANFVLSTIDQAVHQAKSVPSGPVHLNCMFREPLEPSEEYFAESYRESINIWQEKNQPYTRYKRVQKSLNDDEILVLAEHINSAKSGLFVIGQLKTDSEKKTLIKLAAKINWPVFADITSGLRNIQDVKSLVPYFDQMLIEVTTMKTINPHMILHFGRPLTSKRYLKTIQKISRPFYIHIDSGDERLDPGHLVSERFCCDIDLLCNRLIEKCNSNSNKKREAYVGKISDSIDHIINKFCSSDKNISEISVARLIANNIPKDQGLFLASSMPIRDFDMFAGAALQTRNISSNRGVSGIDGTLASAVGYARGLDKGVTVVTGDLALLHDLNSLDLVKKSNNPITIVLVNNGGGGIFTFLPVSRFEHVFEQYFSTPHEYQFEHISNMFGIEYKTPTTNADLVADYISSITCNHSSLIEINVNRDENFTLHQNIQEKIITALEK